MWILCLVLISLETSSAINWQNRIMLHSQARVIVLIMLPEIRLIKKKNIIFTEVHLQYLGGISTEFIGINQTNCFTQKLLTNLRMPRTLSTRTMGLPLDVWMYLFFQGCQCCFSISPEISVFIPQEAKPASSNSALWRESVEEQQGAGILLWTALWRQTYLSEFTRKEDYGGTLLLQEVKKIIIFL